ncbi:MAG: PorT family protein [Bacteroidetes bacterium]|nr:PorT family protein [Bacteroidota bacterium]
MNFKSIIATGLLLGSFSLVQAQSGASSSYSPSPSGKLDVNKIRFGVYIAPNISWMKPTAATDDARLYNVSSDGSKVGFSYGLMAEYFFAENYGIVSGLGINSTGGKIIANKIDQSPAANTVFKTNFEYRLQYLEIPLALKLRTDDIKGFRFFGQLGASMGINIGKKADYKVTYSDAAAVNHDTSANKIKLTGGFGLIAPVMFSMNIGVGAEYPLNDKLKAYVGLFFNNGFTPDVTKPEKFDGDKLGYGSGNFRDANTRLNNMSLRLGLFF